MTTAQELDRSISVERFTETENEFNEPVVTWSVFVKVRAKVPTLNRIANSLWFHIEKAARRLARKK
ncbi:phage head completion protein [Agrobacterium pusense]|uniref:phage head completion protein n=1 Tax=Agrobacterium pusense TaxID=648995 RepID=UPI002449B775|nr:hypothetical protein [Agrobacterium pusense]MDH0873661.1 hypothetical protein [Agrobacterium pusense]